MQRFPTVALISLTTVLTTACRLHALVDDSPGASAHLLPAGTAIPDINEAADLAAQVALHQGVDPAALVASGNVVTRNTGLLAAGPVRYWAFGKWSAAPSPLYRFYQDPGGGAPLALIDHPALVDAVPGDPGYSPIHTLQQVVVTAAYHGELITTAQALQDAIDLGLVAVPKPSGSYVTSPVVLPQVKLEIGGTAGELAATRIYGHGHIVGLFEIGGAFAVQPIVGFVPTTQLSVLREALKPSFDVNRPIFAAPLPGSPPVGKVANYLPLATMVEVDLAPGVLASSITQDSQLFNRNAAGAITATTIAVEHFELRSIVAWPVQVTEGEP